MKCNNTIVLNLLFLIAVIASAQLVPEGEGRRQKTQVREEWTDPTTELIWAARDNGKNANWHKAMDYCRNLRLAGYSDWRLATIDELQGIYDKDAEAPGRDATGATTWHVKGNLYLTGLEWSSTQRTDDRGHSSGLAWYFDFINGRRNDDDAGRFTGFNANQGKRALRVRHR